MESAEQPRKPRPVKQEVRATVTGLGKLAAKVGDASVETTVVNEESLGATQVSIAALEVSREIR